MNPDLNVQDRVLFAKLAEGLEDYVADLPSRDEQMVRRRSRMAAKLRHLPPELALAVTGMLPGGGGGLPVYREPAKNVEAVRALRQATDPERSKLVGAGYGLPAAAAGALLGHLVSGGNLGATAAGAAAGGGTVGILAHRAEKDKQSREAQRLLQTQQTYESLRNQLIQERLQAQQEEQQGLQGMDEARKLQKTSVVSPRYGKLFDMAAFQPKPGPYGSVAVVGGTGDSSLGPTQTGRGMIWEDYYQKWSASKSAGLWSTIAKAFGGGADDVARATKGVGAAVGRTTPMMEDMRFVGGAPTDLSKTMIGLPKGAPTGSAEGLADALAKLKRSDGIVNPPNLLPHTLSIGDTVIMSPTMLGRGGLPPEYLSAAAFGRPGSMAPGMAGDIPPWMLEVNASAKSAATSGNVMSTGVPKPPSPSSMSAAGGMGTGAPRATAPAAPMMGPSMKLPTVNAQTKLPGPVTPNSNLSASMPSPNRMPTFAGRR